jgi:hypothetical protein
VNTSSTPNPSATRLVAAAKTTHTELGEIVLDLQTAQRRLSRLRSELGYAVTMYGSGAVIELPDDGDEPRD